MIYSGKPWFTESSAPDQTEEYCKWKMKLYEWYEKYNKSEYGGAKKPRLNLTIYVVVACFLTLQTFYLLWRILPKNGEMG